MGSDLGPKVILRGAFEYLQENTENGLKIYVIGRRQVLVEAWDSLLLSYKKKRKKIREVSIEFVDAPDVVEMDESVSRGMKKRNSSLAVALQMHKEGEVDAVVSAGSTGVFMARGVLTLGTLEGVARPAIATSFPTAGERDAFMLDVGANVNTPPVQLFQFGQMGSIYCSYVNQIKKPRVGLLSIGEEKIKGNTSTIQAYKFFEESSLNFIGNIEGNDILRGTADVIVTDGFTGNVLLKFGESIKPFLFSKVKRQVSSNLFSRIGAFLMAPFLMRMRNMFDYSHYGGAPLLGVNGVMIICHGSSSPRAIKNAIKMASRMVKKSVNDHIRSKLTESAVLEKVKP